MRSVNLVILAGLAGCGSLGHVNQGQVVEYDRAKGLITLIADSNYRDPAHPRFDVLPAVVIRTPDNPSEMGPDPAAGKLLEIDTEKRQLVIFDSEARGFRTVPFTLVSEREGVSRAQAKALQDGFAVHDASKGRITVYWSRTRKMLELSVPEEFRGLPEDTWKVGDEIRYYYKNPGRALRLMNVTKTDLNRAGR